MIAQTETEPDLVTIGDFAVTQHWLRTADGSYPLAGTRWEITDRRQTVRRSPGWAVLGAILGIPFTAFLSLLLLLLKDSIQVGYVEVAVSGPGFYKATQIRAPKPWLDINMADVSARVAYVRNLVAALD